MNHELIDQAKKEFEHAVSHLKNEFNGLQVGRAHTGLVEGIIVDSYGVQSPLKNIANVSTPDARTIQIQPWDKGLLSAIEKAISSSDLGLNPLNDGSVIRISVPELNEERRLALKKIVSEKAEEARISMRNSRHKAHNDFKKMKEESEITEDDFYVYDKVLQEVLSEYTSQVDKLSEEKEKDIMTV